MNGWERAQVNYVSGLTGTVNVSLLTGPTVDIPYLGNCPGDGELVWVAEIAPGVRLCLGATGTTSRIPWERYFCNSVGAGAVVNNIFTDVTSAASWTNTDAATSTLWPASFVGAASGAFVPNGQFALPWPGKYMVYGVIGFSANATGGRLVQVVQPDGTSVSTAQVGASATGATQMPFVASVYTTKAFANGGIPFQINVRQSSGVALSLVAGRDNSWVEALYLGNPLQPSGDD